VIDKNKQGTESTSSLHYYNISCISRLSSIPTQYLRPRDQRTSCPPCPCHPHHPTGKGKGRGLLRHNPNSNNHQHHPLDLTEHTLLSNTDTDLNTITTINLPSTLIWILRWRNWRGRQYIFVYLRNLILMLELL
jgi:hypothetical protein